MNLCGMAHPSNYFMLFRIRDDRVEITNIFHGSEDFENKLR